MTIKNDITELAHSLKAAANTTADAIDRLKAFPGDELIDLSQHEGEQVDIDITTLNEWYELSSPANVLALLEALEKSESRLHEVAVACATAEQALEKAQRANNSAPAILRQLAEEKQKCGEVAAATAFNYAASALQKELSK
ncbi:TPA: hypothetical protein ACX3LH_005402 [Klebsiella michiganensis]